MSIASVRPEPVEGLIVKHLDLWTTATKRKSTAGRGSSSKVELYGIKKLRELILELAVRGLLVPQDPSDEPASELLKKIASEKSKLIKEGKVKKEKPLPPIAEEERPFELPAAWELVRFGDLLINRDSERIPLSVDERETRRGDYDYYGASGVIDSIDAYIFDKPLLLIGEDGANLINRSTPIAFMAYGKYWVNNHAHVLDGYSEELLLYLCLYINSISLEAYVTGTAQPKMNQAKMNGIVLAIPPLAEQRRIAGKVDELMALCDQLEQQTDTSLSAHQTLVENLLTALTSAADHAQFASAWQRIADHFDTLFTTEESIDKLKQTILQLAVMGKLVPQDPNDEPAAVFYGRNLSIPDGYFRSNKQKIKGDSQVAKDFLPELPSTWTRKTIDQLYSSKHILDYEDGNHGSLYPRASDFSDSGVIFLTAAQIGANGEIYWDECQRLNFDYAKKLTKGWSMRGDVYFTHNATVGRTAVATNPPEKDFILGTSVTLYRVNSSLINPRYLYVFFSSPYWYGQAASVMQQTTRNQVSITKQALFSVSLPPLPEQQRIVSKVDELLALSDQLKGRLNDAQATQLHLADAITERALG